MSKGNEDMMVRVHLFISGLVQGVFFRYSTRSEALRVGLKGWVKNVSDGRVEVMIEGERSEVESLVAWCHQGPPGAIVRHVEYNEETYTGEYTNFFIKH